MTVCPLLTRNVTPPLISYPNSILFGLFEQGRACA